MKQTAGSFLCTTLIRISRECKCFFFQLKAKKMVSCAKRLKKSLNAQQKLAHIHVTQDFSNLVSENQSNIGYLSQFRILKLILITLVYVTCAWIYQLASLHSNLHIYKKCELHDFKNQVSICYTSQFRSLQLFLIKLTYL